MTTYFFRFLSDTLLAFQTRNEQQSNPHPVIKLERISQTAASQLPCSRHILAEL